MSREIRNRISYTVMCISLFASVHRLDEPEAYRYLKQFGGLEFLKEFYDVEHLLSLEDSVDDLTAICRRNGGMVA